MLLHIVVLLFGLFFVRFVISWNRNRFLFYFQFTFVSFAIQISSSTCGSATLMEDKKKKIPKKNQQQQQRYQQHPKRIKTRNMLSSAHRGITTQVHSMPHLNSHGFANSTKIKRTHSNVLTHTHTRTRRATHRPSKLKKKREKIRCSYVHIRINKATRRNGCYFCFFLHVKFRLAFSKLSFTTSQVSLCAFFIIVGFVVFWRCVQWFSMFM